MMSSSSAYKRARPAFGTILRLEIESAETDPSQTFTHAFALAEQLEQVFSKFRPTSDLSRLNLAPVRSEVEIPGALFEVLKLALELHALTTGGFTPYLAGSGEIQLARRESRWFATKTSSCALDLSGIAKGYAVDKICELIQHELPHCTGVVNAGGDLRFINTAKRTVAIRNQREVSSLRQLHVERDGVATSSFAESRGNPLSSTVYNLSPRANLDESCTVTVMAPVCAVADALTKAVWFGAREIIPLYIKKYNAQVLIFDADGKLREHYA